MEPPASETTPPPQDTATQMADEPVVSAAAPAAAAAATVSLRRRLRCRVGEKIRFVDEEPALRSKTLVYVQHSASLEYDVNSTYPFPRFHIPTREEQWEAQWESLRAEADERAASGSGAQAATTPSRKRKATAASSPSPTPAAATPPELGRRNSARKSKAVADTDEEMADATDDEEEPASDAAAEEQSDEDDDAESKSSVSSEVRPSAPQAKRRGRPKGSKNKPRDPELALQFEMERDAEAAAQSSERLTLRQRAMLEGEEQELMSLPNRPLKTKNVSELTEEQLARKAAANERRKVNEKERMEQERSDTILKLLTNTPAKKGAAPTDSAASTSSPAASAAPTKKAREKKEPVLGAIPAPAKIRASRAKKGATKGAPAASTGDEDFEPEENEDDPPPAMEDDEAAAPPPPTNQRSKYSRAKIVYRNYLEVDAPAPEADGGDAKQVKLEGPKSTSADAAADTAAVAASSPFVPPVARLVCSVSFPCASPLPPPPLFSFAAGVAHLHAYRRTQRNDNEADDDEPMDEQPHHAAAGHEQPTPMEVESAPTAPAAAAQPSPSAGPRVRPSCARPTCPSVRRYTDSASQLPICSLVCLDQLKNTATYRDAVTSVSADAAKGKLQAAA